MKRRIMSLCFLLILLVPTKAKADLWGGDLPLLAEIVFNTLRTLTELERQSSLMRDEMDGVRDKIYRIQTIADLVQPSTWDQWRDPREAVRRLRTIYYTLPKEYRSDKADMIEDELSRAMNTISRISGENKTTFHSGKELEQKGADASPGVAQKLTASGVGTLIAMEAQSQVLQSHITSLLAQMVADGQEKEARAIVARGTSFSGISTNLSQGDSTFSSRALLLGRQR